MVLVESCAHAQIRHEGRRQETPYVAEPDSQACMWSCGWFPRWRSGCFMLEKNEAILGSLNSRCPLLVSLLLSLSLFFFSLLMLVAVVFNLVLLQKLNLYARLINWRKINLCKGNNSEVARFQETEITESACPRVQYSTSADMDTFSDTAGPVTSLRLTPGMSAQNPCLRL